MFRCTRPMTLAAAATAALILAGCATLRVNSYAERGADFTRYRSYAWAERPASSTGDPRLDNNRFFSQRVEDAVNMQLAARGFEQASAGTADVIVHIHARVDQRLETGMFERIDGHCAAEKCQPEVYDAGTLMIDVVDGRTKQLAWRGWAEGSLDGVIDDQRRMEAKIDEAVAKIVARFPTGR